MRKYRFIIAKESEFAFGCARLDTALRHFEQLKHKLSVLDTITLYGFTETGDNVQIKIFTKR